MRGGKERRGEGRRGEGGKREGRRGRRRRVEEWRGMSEGGRTDTRRYTQESCTWGSLT